MSKSSSIIIGLLVSLSCNKNEDSSDDVGIHSRQILCRRGVVHFDLRDSERAYLRMPPKLEAEPEG